MDENEETTRTVGDMPQEEFFAGMAGAMSAALDEAGAGRANGGPASGVRDEQTRDEPRPHYGDAARACFVFERDAEILALPTADAREQRIQEYLDCHDWAVALTQRDNVRAEKIAAGSYGRTVEQMRQLTSGTGSGEALVPIILEGPIIEKRTLADKITPRATSHQSSSGRLQLAEEGTIIAAAGTLEAGAITPSTITYAPINLALQKSTAVVVTSREVVMDAAASMQLVRNFSSQAGRAFGDRNNDQNINGTGTAPSYTAGILPNADPITGTGGIGWARSKILTMMFGTGAVGSGMSAPFRRGSFWIMSSNAILITSQLETTGGQLLYPNAIPNQTVPGPISGDPNSPGVGIVEGLPVLELEDAGDVVVLANLEFFQALVENSIRVETTTDGGSNFLDDTQSWKFVQRQDGSTSLSTLAFKKTDAAIQA